MSHHPPIQVVNERDEPVQGMPIAKVYDQGLIHRVIHIAVEDDEGNILLQKRSKNMINDANKWDISVGGHVDEGETYHQTAVRELHEELGLTDIQLSKLGHRYKEIYMDGQLAKRFATIYRAHIPNKTPIKFQRDEISEVKWVNPAEAKQLVAFHPESAAAGLKEYIREYYRA